MRVELESVGNGMLVEYLKIQNLGHVWDKARDCHIQNTKDSYHVIFMSMSSGVKPIVSEFQKDCLLAL